MDDLLKTHRTHLFLQRWTIPHHLPGTTLTQIQNLSGASRVLQRSHLLCLARCHLDFQDRLIRAIHWQTQLMLQMGPGLAPWNKFLISRNLGKMTRCPIFSVSFTSFSLMFQRREKLDESLWSCPILTCVICGLFVKFLANKDESPQQETINNHQVTSSLHSAKTCFPTLSRAGSLGRKLAWPFTRA